MHAPLDVSVIVFELNLGCSTQGLKLLLDSKKGETAAIFEDSLFSDCSHWFVSTSNLSSPLLDGWGWGEVVTDGIGVAYNIKPSRICANVTCCQGSTACHSRCRDRLAQT